MELSEKPPPLPLKNSLLVRATIECQEDTGDIYSSPRKVNFRLGRDVGAFNEDEEEFEDVCHPDDDPMHSIEACRDNQQLIETHFV